MTLNLVPRAVVALEEVARLTGDSKTDSVNRALRVYVYLEQQKAAGKKLLLLGQDGLTEEVVII